MSTSKDGKRSRKQILETLFSKLHLRKTNKSGTSSSSSPSSSEQSLMVNPPSPVRDADEAYLPHPPANTPQSFDLFVETFRGRTPTSQRHQYQDQQQHPRRTTPQGTSNEPGRALSTSLDTSRSMAELRNKVQLRRASADTGRPADEAFEAAMVRRWEESRREIDNRRSPKSLGEGRKFTWMW
jgi:hypothetical protein